MKNKTQEKQREGIRAVPDQLIAYLAEHDIFGERAEEDIRGILEGGNHTYDGPYNPIFGTIPREKDPRLDNRGILRTLGRDLGNVKAYLSEKEDPNNDMVSEDTVMNGPYSHGVHVTRIFNEPNYGEGILDDKSKIMPVLGLIGSLIHTAPQGIIYEIDKGIRKDTEFERDYVEGLKNILIGAPRILTLGARSELESFSDLPIDEARELSTSLYEEPEINFRGTDQYERRAEFMRDASQLWKNIASEVSGRVQYDE